MQMGRPDHQGGSLLGHCQTGDSIKDFIAPCHRSKPHFIPVLNTKRLDSCLNALGLNLKAFVVSANKMEVYSHVEALWEGNRDKDQGPNEI